MDGYAGGLYLVRAGLRLGVGLLYVVAFASALNQFRALLGERGLLPVGRFLARASFREAPSLFHWRYSDRLFEVVAGVGLALSLLAAFDGVGGPPWVHVLVWLVVWALYLSIVNVGQIFYAFGWESLALEAGFFTAFLGPNSLPPSLVTVLLFRWLLFRVELGAGLIKLRHDPCWRELTCLYYHHETQPLPNPLSWYVHRLPRRAHRAGVLFSHFVQLVVPFAFFAPQPFAALAGGLTMLHQFLLIGSGNYAWLNWMTVVLAISCLDDALIGAVIPLAIPTLAPAPLYATVVPWALAGAVALLSVKPVLNLFSSEQLMNYSYNPLHLVNTYGAFGSVTKERYEVVLEGTLDDELGPHTEWREYEFKAKPGDPRRRPPQVAPYHLRLDWLMWFLPFSVIVDDEGVLPGRREFWFVRFIQNLLLGDQATLRLLRRDPFAGQVPKAIRARYYRYQFTTWREHRDTGAWWKRTLVGEYLPPARLRD